MKLPKSFVDQLTKDMQLVYNHFKPQLVNAPDVRVMWFLFDRVISDRSQDDSHPRFTNQLVSILDRETGEEIRKEQREPDLRLIPFISNDALHSIYTTYNVNDDHILTAIKKAWKDIHK